MTKLIKKKSTVISMKKHEEMITDLEKEIESLKTERKEVGCFPGIAIEALNYYATKDNYRLIKSFTHHYRIIREGGKLAREALNVINNK